MFGLQKTETFRDLVFEAIDKEQLLLCSEGDELALWTQADYHSINAYRPGTTGGQGRVFSLRKDKNQTVADAMAKGVEVWAVIDVMTANQVIISAHRLSDAEMEARKMAKLKARADYINRVLTAPYKKHRATKVQAHIHKGITVRQGDFLTVSAEPINSYFDDIYRKLPVLDSSREAVGYISGHTASGGKIVDKIINAFSHGYMPELRVASINSKVFCTGDQESFWYVYEVMIDISFPPVARP